MSTAKNSRRKKRQRVAARYSKAREDAQLLDIIPTTPTGAVHDEKVDPATQDDPVSPGLVGQAVRSGWAVPEDKKPVIVKKLIDLVEGEVAPELKIAAARTLRTADRDQWERDNPDKAGKTKGSTNVMQGQAGQVIVTGRAVMEAVLGQVQTEPQRRLAELEAAEKEIASGKVDTVPAGPGTDGDAEPSPAAGHEDDAERGDGQVA